MVKTTQQGNFILLMFIKLQEETDNVVHIYFLQMEKVLSFHHCWFMEWKKILEILTDDSFPVCTSHTETVVDGKQIEIIIMLTKNGRNNIICYSCIPKKNVLNCVFQHFYLLISIFQYSNNQLFNIISHSKQSYLEKFHMKTYTGDRDSKYRLFTIICLMKR